MIAPDGFINEWSLDKIVVNGASFDPFVKFDTLVKVYDANRKLNRGGIKIGENNTFSLFWRAPVGAGVISPHANVTLQLRIDGQKKLPIDSEIIENLNLNNIQEDFQRKIDRSTPEAIIFIIIIIAIIVLMMFLLPRLLTSLVLIDRIKNE